MNLRPLRLLLPLVVALSGLSSTQDVARAPERIEAQVSTVRSRSHERPQSAELENGLPSSVLAADAKPPHRAAKPAEHRALPDVRDSARSQRVVHARTTGLTAAPVSTRQLAIPFDATAPPRQA